MNRYQEFVMTGQLPPLLQEISEVEDENREQSKKAEKEAAKMMTESSTTALRTLRKCWKMLLEEYRKNERNGEVFAILALALMGIKKQIAAMEKEKERLATTPGWNEEPEAEEPEDSEELMQM